MSFCPDWVNSQMGGICNNLPIFITMIYKTDSLWNKKLNQTWIVLNLLGMYDITDMQILSADIGLK